MEFDKKKQNRVFWTTKVNVIFCFDLQLYDLEKN